MTFTAPKPEDPDKVLESKYNRLCALCGQRWGDHSMTDICPTVMDNKIVRHCFEQGQRFRVTERYKFKKDVGYIDTLPK